LVKAKRRESEALEGVVYDYRGSNQCYCSSCHPSGLEDAIDGVREALKIVKEESDE
jgi:hypothetical protein